MQIEIRTPKFDHVCLPHQLDEAPLDSKLIEDIKSHMIFCENLGWGYMELHCVDGTLVKFGPDLFDCIENMLDEVDGREVYNDMMKEEGA